MQINKYGFSAEKETHLHLIYELCIRHFSPIVESQLSHFMSTTATAEDLSTLKLALGSFSPVRDWIIWKFYFKCEEDGFKSLEKGKLSNSDDRFIIWFAFYLVKYHFHVYLLHKFNPNSQILSLYFIILYKYNI